MAIKLKTSDPVWWALFSAGGTVAAFFLPVHILIGVGIAFGWISPQLISYQRLVTALTNPLFRLYLLLLISLPLFHWAHRFRYVLMDMGLRGFKTPVSILCYGTAGAGSVLTGALLVFCL